ncbi:Bug family tripartite tricarboxylate transporter substrate binding protein [Pseudochelatococcus sp. B33]
MKVAATAVTALLLSLMAAVPAGAQEYPSRDIHAIVPFPPGGGTDTISRLMMAKLSEKLGATIVVDNRPGAGGSVGTAVAAQAKPDGYTIVVVSASHAINPSLYNDLPFDPVKNFAPVTLLATGPGVLVVPPSLDANTVEEFIAAAKGRDFRFASAGIGTPPHLAGELFASMAGIKLIHVPYQGNGPAMVDLLAGRVESSFPTIPSALQHIERGALKALAVTGAERSSFLPDVPTVAEAGVPGYEATSWYGLLAPAGTPPEIVAKLHASMEEALKDEDLLKQLSTNGLEPSGISPEAFAQLITSEKQKWAKVVHDAGIEAQ